MALSANVSRVYGIVGINGLPVKASSVIYAGSAVGVTAGYARALVAGDPFKGFALAAQTGGATDGLVYVNVQTEGLISAAITSAAVTDIGSNVYMSDDGTFTLTPGANSLIGYVYRWESTGNVVVRFKAAEETGGENARTFSTIAIPVVLATVTNGDVATGIIPGFAGRIESYQFITTVAVTTAAKAATFNLEIGTTNLTGGVLVLSGTQALGAVTAATAITAANTFTATDAISLEASSVTTFIEGEGTILITVSSEP